MQLRRAFSFLTMLIFLLVTLEFMMTRGSVVDPDIWWHLRNAEYLFQHHQFPRTDMYSFTVAGHPWIITSGCRKFLTTSRGGRAA